MHIRHRIGWLGIVTFGTACHIGTPGTAAISTDFASGSSSGATSSSGASSSSGAASEVSTSSAATGSDTTDATSSGSTLDADTFATNSSTGDDPACGQDGAGQPLHARIFANIGDEYVTDLVIGNSGILTAIYTASSNCGGMPALDFGQPLPATYESVPVPVIAQYDLLGHVRSHRIHGSEPREALDVATDAAGNIYVVGYFDGAIVLPPAFGEYAGAAASFGPEGDASRTGFLAVFDASGKYVWSMALRASDTLIPHGIAAAANGRVAVVGGYNGTLNLAASCAEATQPSRGIFVAVFDRGQDAFLEQQWVGCAVPANGAATWGGSAVRAALRPDGGVVATGYFEGSLAFAAGAPTLTAVGDGSSDIFLAAWTSAGAHAWSVSCGTSASDEGHDIALGADGRVLVTGNLGDGGSCIGDLDPDKIPGQRRGFVAALQPPADEGQPVTWLFERRLSGESELLAIVEGPCGDITVAGYGNGPIAWEDMPDLLFSPDPPGGGDDIIVAKLSVLGVPRWGRRLGSSGRDWGSALATDASGELYLGGSYSDAMMVDADLWPAPSKCLAPLRGDTFLVHLPP